MAVTKIVIPDKVTSFAENSAIFSCGKLYAADGGYTKAEAIAAFADLTAKQTEVSSNFIELSDLAEKPFKMDSKVTKLKTLNYTIEGKRTNTIELTLVGLTQERKTWLEEELGKTARTFLLDNTSGDSVMILNNKRWICEWAYEADGAFNAVISTEYSGPTTSGFMVFQGIPEAGSH